MKRLVMITVASCLAFLLTACGEQKTETTPAPESTVAHESVTKAVEKTEPTEKSASEAEPTTAQEAGATTQE